MKLSKRRYAQIQRSSFTEGVEQGRQEALDVICNWLGKQVYSHKSVPLASISFLEAQAFAEGMRLLAYNYDDLSVKEAVDFTHHYPIVRRLQTLIDDQSKAA